MDCHLRLYAGGWGLKESSTVKQKATEHQSLAQPLQCSCNFMSLCKLVHSSHSLVNHFGEGVGPLGELSPPAVQADLKDGSDKTASRLGEEEEEKEEEDKVTKMDQHNTSGSQRQTASLSPKCCNWSTTGAGNEGSLHRCFNLHTYLCDVDHVGN